MTNRIALIALIFRVFSGICGSFSGKSGRLKKNYPLQAWLAQDSRSCQLAWNSDTELCCLPNARILLRFQ
jgi:hypothetical protein